VSGRGCIRSQRDRAAGSRTSRRRPASPGGAPHCSTDQGGLQSRPRPLRPVHSGSGLRGSFHAVACTASGRLGGGGSQSGTTVPARWRRGPGSWPGSWPELQATRVLHAPCWTDAVPGCAQVHLSWPMNRSLVMRRSRVRFAQTAPRRRASSRPLCNFQRPPIIKTSVHESVHELCSSVAIAGIHDRVPASIYDTFPSSQHSSGHCGSRAARN
jgi:hypothetical protein